MTTEILTDEAALPLSLSRFPPRLNVDMALSICDKDRRWRRMRLKRSVARVSRTRSRLESPTMMPMDV